MSVPSSPSALAGPTRGGPPGISLTITEPANQAVRPAYAKLDEGCSDGPSRASMHRGRTMGKHKLAFVAFDSAKEKHAVAIADDGRDGEVRYLGEIDNSPDAVRKLVAKLSRQYERLHFCYEAGPTGYGLHRQLTDLDRICDVIAPTMIQSALAIGSRPTAGLGQVAACWGTACNLGAGYRARGGAGSNPRSRGGDA